MRGVALDETNAVLEVRNLSVYGGLAETGCTNRLMAGEVGFLWGPSFARDRVRESLSGFFAACYGDVRILGIPIGKWEWSDLRRWFGHLARSPYISQSKVDQMFTSKFEDSGYAMQYLQPLYSRWDRRNLDAWSKYEKMTVAIALHITDGAALISLPELSGMGPRDVERLLELIKIDAARSGRSYLIETSDVAPLATEDSQVWFCEGGRLVCGGYWVSRDVWFDRSAMRYLEDCRSASLVGR